MNKEIMNNNIIENKVEVVDLAETMSKNYVEYAVDVIVNRALPDVRDGLKPVLRRIIYGMYSLKMLPDTQYKKCARIVGEVLGKYHPHGDSSVYDALVRMAQDFSLRYPLVDGHGNFGSVDGDSAAAMRYTEAKMNPIALELVKDIEKETVNFIPNFDGEELEPAILPSSFPNLLVNGSSGIAVGFASNIPPHNLTEVVEGIKYRLKNKECELKDIMRFIKSPDFPTGSIIVNPENLENIYRTGVGVIKMRCRHHIETIKEGNKEIEAIVITELPYQVNKAKLITSIDEYQKNKKYNAILDIRDESDRNGIRIVIELKDKGSSKRVLQELYKKTNLQCNYNVNNVALVNNLPKDRLSLIELIDYYIEHQKEILIRKTKYDKTKHLNRLHILNGLTTVLDNLDFTISIIKNSKTKSAAKEELKNKLSIDDIQANAILQMQLGRLTSFEKDNIYKEVDKLNKDIKFLNTILEDEDVLINELIKSLDSIKYKYGDERRTSLLEIEEDEKEEVEEYIEPYNTVIQLTKEGYIKKLRARSIKCSSKNKLKENDVIISEIKGNNKDKLLLFSDLGNVFKIKSNDLKELKTGELGQLISSYCDLDKKEKIKFIVSTDFISDKYLISIFDNGKISKVDINSYNVSTRKFAYNHNNVIDIVSTNKDKDVLLISDTGKALIINTKQINSKAGRKTQGNIAMRLKGDTLIKKAIFNIKNEDIISLQTQKGKQIEIKFNEISPKDNTNWFDYIYGNVGNMGNYIYNVKAKGDNIINISQLFLNK